MSDHEREIKFCLCGVAFVFGVIYLLYTPGEVVKISQSMILSSYYFQIVVKSENSVIRFPSFYFLGYERAKNSFAPAWKDFSILLSIVGDLLHNPLLI